MKSLRIYLSLTAALIAPPALAQSDTASTKESETPPSETSSQDGGITDIVVSAQRRDARLQDVPITLSAFTSEALETAQIRNVIEVQSLSPSVVINRLGNALTPFIRGVGSLDATVGQESAVAMYVDGVYRPAPFIANVDFNSVERVEVLKGPQGTLFGRNATGGAIHIITREPTFQRSMDVSLAAGSYETVDARGYVTGGLSDTIAADLAITYHNQMDGFGRNRATGNDIYRDRNFAMRSKWMYQGERAKLVLTGEYAELTNELDGRQAFSGKPLIDGTLYTGRWWDVDSSVDASYQAKVWGVSGKLDYSFDAFDIVSITAFQKAKMQTDWDQDGGPNALIDVSVDEAVFRTFTQELQILSRPGSAVKWIAGAFFMDDRTGTVPPKGLGLIGSGVGGAIGLNGLIRTKSYSVFGEATVPLGGETNLTGGIRWTKDKREISSFTDVLDPQTFQLLLRLPNPDSAARYTKPSWRVILDHHLNPDVMVYASVSRGFKSGNFSAINPAAPPFRPEVLTAYEAGIKSDLLSRKLRLNLSGFYYRYNDMQLPVNFGTLVGTANAGSSEIAGGEAEGQLALGNFNMTFGAGFLYSKFLKFEDGICYVPSPGGGDVQLACSHTGDRLPKTPRFTLNLSPSYTVETGLGKLTASASYYHSSSYIFEASSTMRQSAYDLLNSRIELRTSDDRLGFAIFAKNLLKEKYAQFAISQVTGDTFSAAPPRTFGAEVSFSF